MGEIAIDFRGLKTAGAVTEKEGRLLEKGRYPGAS
jgi:hypothetical protein